MREKHFYYLNAASLDKLGAVTKRFTENAQSPEQLLNTVKNMLPVRWSTPFSWKACVEGFYHVTERMISQVMEFRRKWFNDEWNREQVISEANLRPLYSYHWASSPWRTENYESSREEYLRDPTTSLVKLKDDILALARLLRKLQAEKEYQLGLKANVA